MSHPGDCCAECQSGDTMNNETYSDDEEEEVYPPPPRARTIKGIIRHNIAFLTRQKQTGFCHGGPADEETDLICQELVALNERWFITTCSQPGLEEEFKYHNDPTRTGILKQRAFVDGFVPHSDIPWLVDIATKNPDIILYVYSNETTAKYNTSLDRECVTLYDGEEQTFIGWDADDKDISHYHNVEYMYKSDGVANRVMNKLKADYCTVFISDREYGRNDKLWQVLGVSPADVFY